MRESPIKGGERKKSLTREGKKAIPNNGGKERNPYQGRGKNERASHQGSLYPCSSYFCNVRVEGKKGRNSHQGRGIYPHEIRKKQTFSHAHKGDYDVNHLLV
jgi:hypothetical protein